MAKRSYKKTQVQYAKEYGIDVRTVRRHMEKQSPLDDPTAMEAVFAAQKNRPAAKGPGVTVDAAALTNEQLENPSNDAEAKLFERILICRKLAHQVNEAKRLVIPRDEVRSDLMRIGANLKVALLSLPAEIPALVGKDAAAMSQWGFEWAHETLSTFSSASGKLYV